ncbi:alpha-hydroxy acid oxidase [Streptomyces varsoviensis]|uniref:alpha-hydroxy acid oxidase n=1 Tax=Streptomyces varsoviensis TaxID=67373 RepID=UPI000662C1F1|nr:alpha-hydroxy acid oxidase [Streptomyces varsoviensis]
MAVADFAAVAQRVLPAEVWDFIAGGSGAELTLAANRAALDRIGLVPRVLAGASGCDTEAALPGAPTAAMPVAVAPMAYQQLAHEDGELATARAAAAAGVPFALSMLSSRPIESVTALGGITWFQLYCLRDRGATAELVVRAEEAGCAALVVTVDVPRMARRLRDLRNGFALPTDVAAANLDPASVAETHDRRPGVSAVAEHTARAFAAGLSWDDISMLRERTRLPLIVKGLLDPRDAALAADLGADAVVVSNHGGRQLDSAVAAVDMLPAVREATPARCRVLLDSGVRGGTDVLKALVLGASGVLLGRPALWGLAAGGEAGVRQVLDLLAVELRSALELAGCADLDAVRLLTARVPDARTYGGGVR